MAGRAAVAEARGRTFGGGEPLRALDEGADDATTEAGGALSTLGGSIDGSAASTEDAGGANTAALADDAAGGASADRTTMATTTPSASTATAIAATRAGFAALAFAGRGASHTATVFFGASGMERASTGASAGASVASPAFAERRKISSARRAELDARAGPNFAS
jgi:hypothetical protein